MPALPFNVDIVTDEMLKDAVKYTKVEMQVKRSMCTNNHIQKYIMTLHELNEKYFLFCCPYTDF